MIERPTPTLAIVGAGAVGSTIAYAALMRGAARRVVLHDVNAAKVRAEVLDIAHGIQFMPMGQIEGSDDVGICAGADIVAVTAGAKQRPGQTRMQLAEATVGLMRTIMPRLVQVAPDATYVMVTNPVDVVTYAALAICGLPPTRLFGSGTVLDSSRLRWLVATEVGVSVHNVHAYVAGEHGDSEIPLWSSASVGGVPLLEWERHTGLLGQAARERIAAEVVGSAYQIIEGKGATNYAVALAVSRIVESVLRDERRVLPVSSLLSGWQGIDEVCMSVPTVLHRGGAGERLAVPLSDGERVALARSADRIRAVARGLGF